jgi:hypothetical protein
MEGQVKITVIATGFDRPAAAKSISPSSVQTPVDLQNYTSWRQESVEKVAAAGGGGARMSITRRPALELPLMPPAVEPDGNGAPGAEFEPVSPLDVPAFCGGRLAAWRPPPGFIRCSCGFEAMGPGRAVVCAVRVPGIAVSSGTGSDDRMPTGVLLVSSRRSWAPGSI